MNEEAVIPNPKNLQPNSLVHPVVGQKRVYRLVSISTCGHYGCLWDSTHNALYDAVLLRNLKPCQFLPH